MLAALVALTLSGVIAPWTGRFYSLWDTNYAKIHIPIIASVSEHQPTSWTSFFFDLQYLVFLFPAGVYFCFRELRDEHVFVILYSVLASYFAGVMVRLMLTLTPIVCVASAITVSNVFDTYLRPTTANVTGVQTATDVKNGGGAPSDPAGPAGKASKTPAASGKASKSAKASTGASDIPYAVRIIVLGCFGLLMFMFSVHCTWVTSNAYSSPSIVLASRARDGSQLIIDDFREAYYWLRKNTPADARVMSWWDYGYQLAGMANRVTLVDNNTWNNTHIATVGKAMSLGEEAAYKILRRHDVDYVLVVFGGLIGYAGDDINKFLWMVRIAEGVWPEEVKESAFFSDRGEYRVDGDASPTMRNSLMYKMSYYRLNDLYRPSGQPAVDRVRGVRMPQTDIKLSVLEEAYTTENWIVRVYKVKDPDPLGRSLTDATAFEGGKVTKRKKKRDSALGKAGRR
ncbi:MAG: Oligosaccharyl transferase STT3 subunit-domain-containing protein [Olpidium bornovanus]|uniref:Dolichyl-diphosphooligosaccharide--protein glycosyltransferase subunit STT3 n=1 Tax=Olpidium bornovanus TaxID=278681 RepID=A0A8H8DJE9_9FUNG|nr:MAG: Oligosaccharyl transferase STT3 subunit-domain-containing protein [Olpidium bornovanus]